MRKFFAFVICILIISTSLSMMFGCNKKTDVTIYTSMEDFRNEKLKSMLSEKFPDLKIDVQYYPSGNNAAKVKAEGTSIVADIVMDIDYGYLEGLKSNFADLSGLTIPQFLPQYLSSDNKYVPLTKSNIAVIINTDVMTQKNLPIPTTYADLTKAIYIDNIEMPNPTASGTGYGFIKGMINLMGEENAFTYFDDLQKNIKQFTSSGSGPVNALVRGECAIGIGLQFQAIQEINKGAKLQVLYLNEGIPYGIWGAAIINGREKNSNVTKVFEYIISDFSIYDKTNLSPGVIFKDQQKVEVENWPENVTNIDMNGIENSSEKERILAKWKY